MGCRITMGKHENWKSSWGKEGQQHTFAFTASKKVWKKGRMWDRNKITTSPNWQNLLKLLDPSEVMELKLADPQKGSTVFPPILRLMKSYFICPDGIDWRLVSSPFQFFPFYTWLCCRAFFPVSFRPVCCWLDLFSCAWRPRGLKIGCQLLKVISFLIFFSWCSIGMTFSFPVLILTRTRWWTPRM